LKITDYYPIIKFGFRQRHSAIEYTHQIAQRINKSLENKQYCFVAFLDISQAFDKLWHTGLLYKRILSLPLNCFLIPKSYLHSRHFLLMLKMSAQNSPWSKQAYPKAVSSPKCTGYSDASQNSPQPTNSSYTKQY
jgi:hypothetical protein